MWDRWDKEGRPLAGLRHSFNALASMREVWADEPRRTIVLDRIKASCECIEDARQQLPASERDNTTCVVASVQARACLAKARHYLGKSRSALKTAESVLAAARSLTPDAQVNAITFYYDDETSTLRRRM